MKLFLALLALWLILNESFAAGHVLLGAVLALGGVAVYSRLEPAANRVRNRPLAALQLLALVFADIVRSNVAVARIVLGLGAGQRNAGFLALPLELRHPGGLAVVACIITATPGTIWMSYEPRERILLIHVFDLIDETEWIRTITDRYARPLQEIFA